MRLLRRLLNSRGRAAVAAVLALALQASSSGYVQACPMKVSSMSAKHSCCQAAKACHMPVPSQRKACCFFGVMSPCADGAVSEARLTAPTSVVAAVAVMPATPAVWATPAAVPSAAAPPIPEAPPHRSSILLI